MPRPRRPQPSFLQLATGTGTLAVGTIIYEQTVLTNVHSNVTLNHGIIQLNPLTSQIYGGQENGSVTVDTRAQSDDLRGQCQAHRRGCQQAAVVGLVGERHAVRHPGGDDQRDLRHAGIGRHCADVEWDHDDESGEWQDHEARSAGRAVEDRQVRRRRRQRATPPSRR